MSGEAFMDNFIAAIHADVDGSTHPPEATAEAAALVSAARKRVPAYAEACPDADNPPVLTKAFFKGPLGPRCWDGCVDGISSFQCSSGSTGGPTVWPRSLLSELTMALMFDRVFRVAFATHERSTLVVVCFHLGAWAGGMLTTFCVNHLHRKGHKLAMVTPGTKHDDVLALVTALGPDYSQVVLLGYPPFVKGVIDAGVTAGVPWSDYDLGIVTAGEVCSEEWRTLVADRGCIKAPLRRIVSLYGSADVGAVGAESPFCAVVHRWLADHPAVAKKLFGVDRLPTLCQYDPRCVLLDERLEDSTLVVTGLTPLATMAGKGAGAVDPALLGPPVIKYATGDAGGIMGFDAMCDALREAGADVAALQAEAGGAWVAPFLWVFGRAFWCVHLYGAVVYVENIMAGVQQPEVAGFLTGKFVLSLSEDADMNKWVQVHCELSRGHKASDDLAALVSKHVTSTLIRLNAEFANYVPANRRVVDVSLHAFGDEEWFPVGVKHMYTL